MSRKIKRYNIVELLGKLYDGLAGHKSQDEVVLQVVDAHKRYKASFKQSSVGILFLLEKWGRLVKNKNGALVLVEEDEAQRKQLAFKEGAGVKWEQAKDPKSKLALRAVEEYNAMKRKRLEKEFKAK